jgi:hypothetical protein
MDESILKNINKHFKEVIITLLTYGRSGENLIPLNHEQIELFCKKHEKEIDENIVRMYQDYKNNGDLDELRIDGENKWYQDYIFYKDKFEMYSDLYKDALRENIYLEKMSKTEVKDKIVDDLEKCYELLAKVYPENTCLCTKLVDLCHQAIHQYAENKVKN